MANHCASVFQFSLTLKGIKFETALSGDWEPAAGGPSIRSHLIYVGTTNSPYFLQIGHSRISVPRGMYLPALRLGRGVWSAPSVPTYGPEARPTIDHGSRCRGKR
jgi:hypothetical protein